MSVTQAAERVTELVHKFPILKRPAQKPPFRFNQPVWHILSTGERYAATVESQTWEPSIGKAGEWSVRIGFYPFENGKYDESRVWFTCVAETELEKA